jgi:DNA-binding MarR family transcriptional regulator
MDTPVEVHLARELRMSLGMLVRRMRSERRFSPGQTAVLQRIDAEGESSIGALATAERVRPQSMAQTVGELEGQGLVERRPDPADRRRQIISITADGAAALAEWRHALDGWLAERIERHCSAEERAALEAVVPTLRKLAGL